MRILIAPDKFKGSLTAAQAARAIQQGVQSVWPDAACTCIPMADGGEGIMEAFHAALGGRWISLTVADALGRPVSARLLLTRDHAGHNLAVVETSEACGYLRIAPGERNLPRSTTSGVATLLLAARDAGADTIIAGIGGSATNDGGLGMAAALGYRFLDASGRELEPTPNLASHIHGMIAPSDLRLPPITIASDVANPLLGPRGATTVYGPQKGLRPQDHALLEEGLRNLADVVERTLGSAWRDRPGAGAAGGLGFGLMAFTGATIRSGFDLVAEATGLSDQIAGSDLVITGEGSLDAQTLEGKTAAGVARLARAAKRTVIALAGRITDEDQLSGLFDAWAPLVSAPMPLEEALSRAAPLLEQAARRMALTLNAGRALAQGTNTISPK